MRIAIHIENCHLNFPQIIIIIICVCRMLVNGKYNWKSCFSKLEYRQFKTAYKIEIRFRSYFLAVLSYKFSLITLFISYMENGAPYSLIPFTLPTLTLNLFTPLGFPEKSLVYRALKYYEMLFKEIWIQEILLFMHILQLNRGEFIFYLP